MKSTPESTPSPRWVSASSKSQGDGRGVWPARSGARPNHGAAVERLEGRADVVDDRAAAVAWSTAAGPETPRRSRRDRRRWACSRRSARPCRSRRARPSARPGPDLLGDGGALRDPPAPAGTAAPATRACRGRCEEPEQERAASHDKTSLRTTWREDRPASDVTDPRILRQSDRKAQIARPGRSRSSAALRRYARSLGPFRQAAAPAAAAAGLRPAAAGDLARRLLQVVDPLAGGRDQRRAGDQGHAGEAEQAAHGDQHLASDEQAAVELDAHHGRAIGLRSSHPYLVVYLCRRFQLRCPAHAGPGITLPG